MAKKKVEKKTKAKKPNGCPTKFTSVMKIALKHLIQSGKTDAECCKDLEIDEGTLYNWKKQHVNFFKSGEADWKDGADAQVESALFKATQGGIIIEKKPMNVMVGDGMSRVEVHDHEKYISPNVTAMKFWLTNRKASEWRDRREFDINEINKMSDEDLKKKALAIMEANSE